MQASPTPILLTLAALGCAPAGPSPADGEAPLTGRWGGEHVALTLSDQGGTVEYDCAHGGISEPVRSAAGRFAAAGVHVREHGGPVRVDERPDSLPARYVGTVSGDRLTLQVVVGPDTLGPFALRRGAEPRLYKCL